MRDRANKLAAQYSGPFLEPVDGIAVSCPLHGLLGLSSPTGELYCPTCMEWFPAMRPVPLEGSRLEKKQAALQARLDRKARRESKSKSGKSKTLKSAPVSG
jgi:uncharacterized Zn finger protein (UPF0148 family)